MEVGIRVQNQTVYLKCDRSIEVQARDVFLSDVAEIWCVDEVIRAKLKALKVYRFSGEERKTGEGRNAGGNKRAGNKTERHVISTLKLVERMEKECPGIVVESVGETEVLLTRTNRSQEPVLFRWWKIGLVCLVSFFGTAFTIIAYHNDIGINGVFRLVYELVMNREPEGINVLEVSYSIGLAVGILLFFNHIGRHRFTKDPTPIEVSVRQYEESVDKALIAGAEREGMEEESC